MSNTNVDDPKHAPMMYTPLPYPYPPSAYPYPPPHVPYPPTAPPQAFQFPSPYAQYPVNYAAPGQYVPVQMDAVLHGQPISEANNESGPVTTQYLPFSQQLKLLPSNMLSAVTCQVSKLRICKQQASPHMAMLLYLLLFVFQLAFRVWMIGGMGGFLAVMVVGAYFFQTLIFAGVGNCKKGRNASQDAFLHFSYVTILSVFPLILVEAFVESMINHIGGFATAVIILIIAFYSILLYSGSLQAVYDLSMAAAICFPLIYIVVLIGITILCLAYTFSDWSD